MGPQKPLPLFFMPMGHNKFVAPIGPAGPPSNGVSLMGMSELVFPTLSAGPHATGAIPKGISKEPSPMESANYSPQWRDSKENEQIGHAVGSAEPPPNGVFR